jgi:ribosomal protein L39E
MKSKQKFIRVIKRNRCVVTVATKQRETLLLLATLSKESRRAPVFCEAMSAEPTHE